MITVDSALFSTPDHSFPPVVQGYCDEVGKAALKRMRNRHEDDHSGYVLKCGQYTIRQVSSSVQFDKVSALVQRMYGCRGYRVDNDSCYSGNTSHLVLEASDNSGKVIGTLTLNLDSEEGLLAEELYTGEIRHFRTQGKKICELSRLAMDPAHSSKEMLASLFHFAYIHGRLLNRVTDLFVEVNPRHTGFYKRILGFKQIGEVRVCRRVEAPAVLLHLDLEHVDRNISALARIEQSRSSSFYSYFSGGA
jgi:hypothetical protein